MMAIPDGRLASGGEDVTVRLWDGKATGTLSLLQLGAPIQTFTWVLDAIATCPGKGDLFALLDLVTLCGHSAKLSSGQGSDNGRLSSTSAAHDQGERRSLLAAAARLPHVIRYIFLTSRRRHGKTADGRYRLRPGLDL
jgi:hypothetical protein